MTTHAPAPLPGFHRIPTDAVKPNPDNPRDRLTGITDLARSIQSAGIIQPLIVQPNPDGTFTVISGHRRLAACQSLHMPDVPAIIRRPMRDTEQLAAALIENGQRHGLDPIEEARAIKRIMTIRGSSQADVAISIGRSVAHVSTRLALLHLSADEQEEVRAGYLTITAAVDRGRRNSGHVRAKGSKTVDRAWHFSHRHDLQSLAKARCARLGHKKGRRVSGGIACGECWESVIRADERQHLHEASARTGACAVCGSKSKGEGDAA